jgi:hypothetical protein
LKTFFVALSSLLLLGGGLFAFTDLSSQFGSLELERKVERIRSGGSALLEKIVFPPEVELGGLELLTPEQILTKIPTARAYPWWLTHRNEIALELERDSMIKAARIERCSWSSFTCFRVDIVERRPAAVATMGMFKDGGKGRSLSGCHNSKGVAALRSQWLIDDNGSYIKALEEVPTEGPVRVQFQSGESRVVPLVVGSGCSESEAHRLTEMLPRLVKTLAEIEEVVGRSPLAAQLLSDGGAELQFKGIAPLVKFSLDGPLAIAEQAARLRKLIDQAESTVQRSARVDLGFERVAVVEREAK